MRNVFICAVLLFLADSLPAQTPLNDDCAGIVDLGVAPVCNQIVYSNASATPSIISSTPAENIPACFLGGAAQRDVWFEFTCPETILDFRVTVSGIQPNSLLNPQIAVYRGDCSLDGLAEFYCARAEPGDMEVFVDLPDLTKNDRYFIRVSDYSATAIPNSGNFTICVDEIPPNYQIDDLGSTLCKGTLFDTGGPEGNYGPNENHTFTICPSANPKCIRFTLAYYNIEPGKNFGEAFDFLSFYDGKDLNAPLIGAPIGGELSDNGDGGGGVLYEVQATSGCLTVHFESDDKVQYEGWKGTWVCSDQACVETPAIAIDTTISAGTIAAFLETPFTNVTVAKVDCPKGAYGTFRFPTDKNDLGLEKGLLLTSGRAITVYNAGDAFANHAWTNGGDDDLDYLSLAVDGNSLLSVDACVVEVDAFVASDELSFEYVFGSEEYPEYVNEEYNDIFAFLVSGPGIVGDPKMKNQKNIAVLPGTNTAIQINKVNNLLNWAYYRDNRQGKNIVYDGLTADSLGRKKQLTARTKVIPCNTYHLKFAVADRYASGSAIDRLYDSGVFIANIRGGGPELSISYGSGIDYYIEDCSGNLDQLVLSLPEAKTVPVSYTVTIGGTATRGVDYLLSMPDVVTFQAGQTQLAFPIQPLSDNLVEGTETISISISASFGCGDVVFSTITAEIKDNVAVSIEGGDTLRVCAGGTLQLQVSGALQYFWQPPGLVSNPYVANPSIAPNQDRWYKVRGKISNCEQTDSVFVDVLNPELSVEALGKTNFCLGESVRLQALTNVGDAGLKWSPATGLSDPLAPDPVAKPTKTTLYTATLTLPGCELTKTVQLTVDTLYFPTLTAADTSICQGASIRLAQNLQTQNLYQWSPEQGLDHPTSAGPLATPAQTTTYVLTASTPHGGCSKTDSILVNVGQKPVLRLTTDADTLCSGQQAHLLALVDPPGETLAWQVAPGLSCTTCPDPTVSPTATTTYRVYTPKADCPSDTAVTIHVGVPPLVLLPDDLTLCPEWDTLLSLNFAPAESGVRYTWTSDPPGFSAQTAQPQVKTTQRTTYYLLAKGQCHYRDSVTISLASKALLDAGPDQTICFGQSAQLSAAASEIGVVFWEGGQSNAVITVSPTQNARYVASLRTNLGCRVTDTVAVFVRPPLVLKILDETGKDTLCLGDTVVLRLETLSPAGTPVFWQHGDVLRPFPDDSLLRVVPRLAQGDVATFTYTFRTANPDACPDVEQQFVYVVTRCFALPNAFTPNGDNLNDGFGPLLFGGPTQILQFDIYSRWGERVFSAERGGQTRWNGVLPDGREAVGDVYMYVLKVRYADGQEAAFRGEVTLLR